MRAVVGGPAGYGTAARLGRRTSKGVAGYDILGLMVGSEGTLGGLKRELDPASLILQHAIKDALDPLNIFNPGKVL